MFFAMIERFRALAHQADFVDQAKRGTPAVVGAVTSVWTLNQWVMLATGIYVVIQAAYLLRKWWREESEYARKSKRGRG